MPKAGRPRTAMTYAAGLALVATALGACGQPTPSNPDDSVAPTVSVPVQPTILPETVTPETTDPSAPAPTDDLFDASASLVESTCAATGGVWNFTGTVKNSDSAAHTFTVAVFIVKTSDGSDVASKEIVVTVPAGGSAPVEAKAFHTGKASGVECLTGVTVKGS